MISHLELFGIKPSFKDLVREKTLSSSWVTSTGTIRNRPHVAALSRPLALINLYSDPGWVDTGALIHGQHQAVPVKPITHRQNLSMNTRLCLYEDLIPLQREQLRMLEVHPEQIVFSGDIVCALYSLPAQPDPAIKGFVLLNDELPVAFFLLKRRALLAHWAEPDSATLHALQVDRRVQGQGFGKACLRELPAAVNKLWPEIRQLMLSVSPFNVTALAFYQGMGWIEHGEAYSGERRLVLPLADAIADPRQAG